MLDHEIDRQRGRSVDQKVNDDAGPYRVGTVIHVRQDHAENESWNERSQVKMRRGKYERA